MSQTQSGMMRKLFAGTIKHWRRSRAVEVCASRKVSNNFWAVTSEMQDDFNDAYLVL